MKKAGKGKAIAGLVLGILSIIITLALQSSWSKAIDDTIKELDKMTGASTEEVLKEDLEVTFGDFEISTDEYGLVETKIDVVIKNLSDETKSLDITVEAVDEDGNRLADDWIAVSDLGAGQSTTEKAFTYVDEDVLSQLETATFKVAEASVY